MHSAKRCPLDRFSEISRFFFYAESNACAWPAQRATRQAARCQQAIGIHNTMAVTVPRVREYARTPRNESAKAAKRALSSRSLTCKALLEQFFRRPRRQHRPAIAARGGGAQPPAQQVHTSAQGRAGAGAGGARRRSSTLRDARSPARRSLNTYSARA